MGLKLQRLILLLLCTSGAGFSQAVYCGGGVTDTYCPYCLYDHYGYPCEHHRTVRVIDYPTVKKPELLEPEKKSLSSDPLQNRLARRMETITATNFVSTNAIPINIAPGLAPKN